MLRLHGNHLKTGFHNEEFCQRERGWVGKFLSVGQSGWPPGLGPGIRKVHVGSNPTVETNFWVLRSGTLWDKVSVPLWHNEIDR